MPTTQRKILQTSWSTLSIAIAIAIILITYLSPAITSSNIDKRHRVSQDGFEQSMIRFAVNLSSKKDSIMLKNGFSSLDIDSGIFKFTKNWQKGHFGRLKINDHLFVEFISPKPFLVKEIKHNEKLAFTDISAPICVSLNNVGTCGHISVVATPSIEQKDKMLITTRYIYE